MQEPNGPAYPSGRLWNIKLEWMESTRAIFFFFLSKKKVREGFLFTRWSFSIYLPIYLYRRFVSRRLYVNLPIFPRVYDENKQQPHRLKK